MATIVLGYDASPGAERALDTAVELAGAMAAKDRPTLTTHKRQLHGAAAAVCANG